MRDFPGGPVVKNPPSNAVDVGSIPAQVTKIPHAVGQLSLHTATTEPVRSRARAPQLESTHAATTEPMLWNPHATTREKPRHHKIGRAHV